MTEFMTFCSATTGLREMHVTALKVSCAEVVRAARGYEEIETTNANSIPGNDSVLFANLRDIREH